MIEQTAFDLGDPLTPRIVAPERVPGLRYEAEFLTDGEEIDLLGHVDSSEWRTDLARRVQHYGWRYDYKARRVTPDSYLGPLPSWLEAVAVRLAEHLGMQQPDQVIVNEYLPGQGIASHTDCEPCFGPLVAMISTGSDIQMDFTNRAGGGVPLLLERRSLLALSGAARSSWRHEIPKRRRDRQFGVIRQRRVSLTFRTVVPS